MSLQDMTQFCSNCLNPECSRSLYGRTRFDKRTNEWFDNLFAKVPRLSPDDPRYLPIAKQNFLDVPGPQGRAPAPQTWVDMHTPMAKQQEAAATSRPAFFQQPAPVVEQQPAPTQSEPVAQPVSPSIEVPKPPVPPETRGPVPNQYQLPKMPVINTPSRAGVIVPNPGGATVASSPAARDPWAPIQPAKDRVVKPGARITLKKKP